MVSCIQRCPERESDQGEREFYERPSRELKMQRSEGASSGRCLGGMDGDGLAWGRGGWEEEG